MSGKSERIVRFSADQIEAMRRRGEGRTNWDMNQEEAMRRRRADPEAPVPCEGWQSTVTVELPEPKQQVTLRLDRDVLRWFRAKGRGYQTLINAVLRSYYRHERSREP
jgi:uncharacterized protein (DUF4415 family)